jgi:hypothetical protein
LHQADGAFSTADEVDWQALNPAHKANADVNLHFIETFPLH